MCSPIRCNTLLTFSRTSISNIFWSSSSGYLPRKSQNLDNEVLEFYDDFNSLHLEQVAERHGCEPRALRYVCQQCWPGCEPLDTRCVEGEENGKAESEIEKGRRGPLSDSAGAGVC